MQMKVIRFRRVLAELVPGERPEFPIMNPDGIFVVTRVAMDVDDYGGRAYIKGITAYGYRRGEKGGSETWMNIDPENAPYALHPVLQNMMAARLSCGPRRSSTSTPGLPSG